MSSVRFHLGRAVTLVRPKFQKSVRIFGVLLSDQRIVIFTGGAFYPHARLVKTATTASSDIDVAFCARIDYTVIRWKTNT